MEFVRGDGNNHKFRIPASSWTAGGKLFFTAKQIIDDDNTDSQALIKGDWDDTNVTDTTVNGVAYKEYACYFPPSATAGIGSNGSESLDLLGEFQYVPNGGDPITMPPKGQKLETVVYFDVTRRTT